MFYVIPTCCGCLKTTKRQLSKCKESDTVLLRTLNLHPLDVDYLEHAITLYICKKCSNFLSEVRRFQESFASSTKKLKGYVEKLEPKNEDLIESNNNFEVSVCLNRNFNLKEMKNSLIESKQPVVKLERLQINAKVIDLKPGNSCEPNIKLKEFRTKLTELNQPVVRLERVQTDKKSVLSELAISDFKPSRYKSSLKTCSKSKKTRYRPKLKQLTEGFERLQIGGESAKKSVVDEPVISDFLVCELVESDLEIRTENNCINEQIRCNSIRNRLLIETNANHSSNQHKTIINQMCNQLKSTKTVGSQMSNQLISTRTVENQSSNQLLQNSPVLCTSNQIISQNTKFATGKSKNVMEPKKTFSNKIMKNSLASILDPEILKISIRNNLASILDNSKSTISPASDKLNKLIDDKLKETPKGKVERIECEDTAVRDKSTSFGIETEILTLQQNIDDIKQERIELEDPAFSDTSNSIEIRKEILAPSKETVDIKQEPIEYEEDTALSDISNSIEIKKESMTGLKTENIFL